MLPLHLWRNEIIKALNILIIHSRLKLTKLWSITKDDIGNVIITEHFYMKSLNLTVSMSVELDAEKCVGSTSQETFNIKEKRSSINKIFNGSEL